MNFFGTLFFFILLTCGSYAQVANTDKPSLTAVLELARIKHIEQSRAWLKLIHYEPNFIGLRGTQITSPSFLLRNQEGLQNFSELEATLRAFTLAAKSYEKMIDSPTQKLKSVAPQVRDHSQHPICLFPARLKFLKQTLAEATDYWQNLPVVDCVFQHVFLEAMSAKSFSYVFSSYYSDSPGSAFGHTFFRINRTGEQNKSRQELLDYGVGYAANVTVSNGFLYAMMGLVGGFKGTWTNVPYYYKVREYNDFEARDLWSYDLNLTQDEVEMMTLHLWEVGANYYTYYFFTQNCAFHMLTVLEAAAPRLHLIEHVPFYYVIPADSLKALFYEPGLVKNITYRPSLRKEFLARHATLDPVTQDVFSEYVKTQKIGDSYKNKLNEVQKAKFIDTAIDLFDLNHQHANIESDKDLTRQRERLLGQRAQLDYITPDIAFTADLNEQPAHSHGSSRMGLSAFTYNNQNYGLLEYRFALHDLLDEQTAMPRNSQLEFFNFSFRAKNSGLNLEDFSLFKVMNLNPINFFETKPSWGFDFGIQNRPNICETPNDQCPLGGITAKYGYSYSLFAREQTIAWTMLIADARYNSSLPQTNTYLAPGLELGLLNRFSSDNSVLLAFDYQVPINRNNQHDYLLEYRKSFGQILQLGLRAKNDNYGVLSYWYF